MSSAQLEEGQKEGQTQVPEWEHENVGQNGDKPAPARRSMKGAFGAKLDSVMPPHRRYLGMSRKLFLWVLLAVLIALLVLIIGLAAGLSSKSGNGNLPLPSNGKKYTGDLTYYTAGLGACGYTNGQNDNIVSISHYVFDAAGSSTNTGGNSNANPLCGKMLRASRYDDAVGAQRSVDLMVVDRCTGCQPEDLDTTIGVFEQLADVAEGRVDVTWAWLDNVST